MVHQSHKYGNPPTVIQQPTTQMKDTLPFHLFTFPFLPKFFCRTSDTCLMCTYNKLLLLSSYVQPLLYSTDHNSPQKKPAQLFPAPAKAAPALSAKE